jgi:hypothetical protein
MQSNFVFGKAFQKVSDSLLVEHNVFDDAVDERTIQKSNAEELARQFNYADEKLFSATIGVYEGRIHPDDLKAPKHGVSKANVLGLISLLPQGLCDDESSKALSRAIWNLIAPDSPKACQYTGKELQITLQRIIAGEIKQHEARSLYGIPLRTVKRYMSEIIKYLGFQKRTDLRASWNNGDQERIINTILTLFPDKKKRGIKPILTAAEDDIIASVQDITSSGKPLCSQEVIDSLKAHITAQGLEQLREAEVCGDQEAIKQAKRKLDAKISMSFIRKNRDLFVRAPRREEQEVDNSTGMDDVHSPDDGDAFHHVLGDVDLHSDSGGDVDHDEDDDGDDDERPLKLLRYEDAI